MTVVKSSIVSKPRIQKKEKSGIVDVFSNSQLTCGISNELKNEEISSDPMSEEEDSQAPK